MKDDYETVEYYAVANDASEEEDAEYSRAHYQQIPATEVEDMNAAKEAKKKYLWQLLTTWQKFSIHQAQTADAAARAAEVTMLEIQEAFN